MFWYGSNIHSIQKKTHIYIINTYIDPIVDVLSIFSIQVEKNPFVSIYIQLRSRSRLFHSEVQRLSQGAPLGADGASVDCGASVHPPSLEMLGWLGDTGDFYGKTMDFYGKTIENHRKP